jgi:copper homeostasis protein
MLEIIAETVSDALAAEAGGATQLELVSDIFEDGLTPSIGLIEQVCARVHIPVLVMVRPHARGFVYSPEDVAVMCADIRAACDRGASGLMLGCLTADGRMDQAAIRVFMDAAQGRPLHCHNAWQLAANPEQALEEVIALEFQSVRITGGRNVAGKAEENMARIRQFAQQGAGRIEFLLAGGVHAGNVARLVAGAGVRNVHAGAGARVPPQRGGVVDAGKVAELAEALRKARA